MDTSQERAIADSLNKAEANHKSLLRRKCDWDDPEDVALYKHTLRTDERNRILDRLVKKRKCPICDTFIYSNRQWVINKLKTSAVCRSCWQSNVEGAENVDLNLFEEPELRYKIDGEKIIKARQALGLTRTKFCQLAGWSISWQVKLELGATLTISMETAEMILQVLKEWKIRQAGIQH